MIIFCGHFPEGTAEFSQEETANETSGEWYLRQMLGSANLTGGKLFHILSGNLSQQIEHHFRLALPGRGGQKSAVHEAESNGRALAAGADGRASTAQGVPRSPASNRRMLSAQLPACQLGDCREED